MPISTPIKMSQFENASSLSTSSYIIGLDRNGIGDLVNIKISGSAAGYELSKTRWILNPSVTSSTDPRGDTGAESYSGNGQYWIKSGSVWLQMFNSGSNITGISSSAQLVNGGGNAFTNIQQVTFNFITASLGINAPNITSSNISVSNILHTGGSVGIGKATPNSRLDVNGDTIVTGSLTIATTNNSTYQYIINSTGTGRVLMFGSNMYIGGSTGIGTVIQSNSTNAIQIDTSQNVGVGTASPNAKLDINGNAIITGSITATGGFVGTASYALGVKSNSVYNVKDYGAKGDNFTDDTSAFNAALADINSFGGTLFVPSGSYLLSNVNTISGKKVTVQGENRFSTKLKCTSVSGQLFNFSSIDGAIKDLTFVTSVNRNELTPLITITNCTTFQLQNISSGASGDLFEVVGGNWLFASDVFVRNDAPLGGIALHARGPSLIFTNVILSNNNTVNTTKYPVLWIEGTGSTGMKMSNCSFSGGGPLYRYTGSAITSVADKFTITFPSNHNFGINEYLVISGSGSSLYHNYWRVAAKTSNTVIVSSSLNIGSFSPDLVYSIPCNATITNKYGAINESEMVGVMFEAVGYPTDALSCGLFIDGTKSDGNISGWKFNSCYFDYGKIGGLVVGGGNNGYTTTTARLMFSNIQCETPFRGMSIEQAPGIMINGLQGPMYLINSDPGNCGLYLYSNPNGEGLRGISIANSSLGGDQSWQERTIYTRDYGLIIDGNVDGLLLNNNTIWGISGSVKVENNTNLSGSNVKSSNNLYYSGSADPALAVSISAITSSATINIPWNDQIEISGSTAISTINGGWKSREVSFIVKNGLTFNNSGNISTTKAVTAGEVAKLMFDGTNWRHFN